MKINEHIFWKEKFNKNQKKLKKDAAFDKLVKRNGEKVWDESLRV